MTGYRSGLPRTQPLIDFEIQPLLGHRTHGLPCIQVLHQLDQKDGFLTRLNQENQFYVPIEMKQT